jgi:hypothetical protein
MTKKSAFSKLPPKEREEHLKCIRKFFFNRLPELRQLSATPELKERLGGDIESLGVEGAFEACVGLFDDGRLRILMEDVDNFVIFTFIEDEEEPLIIYEEGEI